MPTARNDCNDDDQIQQILDPKWPRLDNNNNRYNADTDNNADNI